MVRQRQSDYELKDKQEDPKLIKIEITSPNLDYKAINAIVDTLKKINDFNFQIRLSGASYISINNRETKPSLSENEQEELK